MLKNSFLPFETAVETKQQQSELIPTAKDKHKSYFSHWNFEYISLLFTQESPPVIHPASYSFN